MKMYAAMAMKIAQIKMRGLILLNTEVWKAIRYE